MHTNNPIVKIVRLLIEAEENWVEVDQSSAKASADEFKRWYRAEFGEERYRTEFGEDPK